MGQIVGFTLLLFWYHNGTMAFHVSRQQHIRNAAILWVLVGLMLCARGIHMMWSAWHLHGGFFPLLLLLLAILGMVKGTAVMSKSAARAVARIREMNEHTPVWSLYSPAMYLLVAGMVLLGIGLRWAGAHWHFLGIVGALYLLIGVALLAGSATYLRAGFFSEFSNTSEQV